MERSISMSDKNNFTVVANALLDELIGDVTGQNEEWLFGKTPSDNVMIGMIDGIGQEVPLSDDSPTDNKLFRSIPSIGVRFKIPKEQKSISLSLKGKLFYRTRPTLNDQIKYLIEKCNGINGFCVKNKNDLENYFGEGEQPTETIVRINKSISLSSLGFFNLDIENFENSLTILNEEIEKRLAEKVDEVSLSSFRYTAPLIPVSRYLKMNDKTFGELISSYESPSFLAWSIKIYAKIDKHNEYNEILVQLVNETYKLGINGAYETAIFDGGLAIRSENDFVKYDIDLFKHYYMDKPCLYGLGNNCSIMHNQGFIETLNIPRYEQKRIITIDKYSSYVEFEKLINNPVSNLTFICNKMVEKLNAYKQELTAARRIHTQEYIDEFSREIQDFEIEINRFKYGIDLIQNKTVIRESFILMNRTFLLSSDKYKGWRLFQIVFIVSEIADMVNCEFKDTPGFKCNDINNVDLLYFPTGGGKTETFFGCCVFAAFFDRKRGKNNGVTAIIKYPLRLLVAQQFSRLLKLTVDANTIKKQFNIPGDDFAVGFFTGSKNSPNYINIDKRNEIRDFTQQMKNDNYRQIDICPVCGNEMNVVFDEQKWKLIHVCSNSRCEFVPPVYIVDDEIYRYNPCFVVSTIDKMANAGTSIGFKSLLGQSTSRCPVHGFSNRSSRCGIMGCTCELEKNIERVDPVPTLFVQDELHLVNESLGTFDSHYESFVEYYCQSLVPPEQRKQIKYIGATATIADYQKHIRGLYNKNAKMFPTSIKKENFYSKIDENDICRIIVGAALYGGSITESLQKMITIMRIIVSKWLLNVDSMLPLIRSKGFDGNVDDLRRTLNYYLISIVYNNSKTDAGGIFVALENVGNNTLIQMNLPRFNFSEISGDIDFKDIKNTMYQINADDDKFKVPNLIVATSAISHGVDVDHFNQIYFFGIPTQTSEYIQAYSRVGRKYTGIVFDVFRLVRDRDKSYLRNFANFHEYKDILINPVPINRYAKNAIYTTLPGIITALLIQKYVDNNLAMSVTKLIQDNVLTYERLLGDIKSIYSCDSQDSILYGQIIEKEVRNIFNGFRANYSPQKTIAEIVKSATTNHKGPMTNLRDVDVALEVDMRQ